MARKGGGLEGGEWGKVIERVGTVVAVGGVVLLFLVFLLWYGGWAPVLVFLFYPFLESSCLGAPGLAFLLGWGLAFVVCCLVWWLCPIFVGVYRFHSRFYFLCLWG